MTFRMSRRRAAVLFAAVAVGVAAVGNGWAFQPAGKGKEQAKPAPVHPAVAAAQDEYDLLAAQAKLKQSVADAAEKRAKAEDALLKRLDGVATGVEIAQQRAAADKAKAEAELRAGELGLHKLQVEKARRKLDAVTANPPKPDGPSATDEALAKLVQQMTQRNADEQARLALDKERLALDKERLAAEKAWREKEATRLADEARRRKEMEDAATARAENEFKLRQKEVADAETRVKTAELRRKDAEMQAAADAKKRLESELERQRQEKLAVLKRLPGEVADADLRIRAAELKREQTRLELDAIAREIDRLKAARAHLDELKAALEKELNAKNDK
jgi:hypothetical protein